MSPRTEAQRAHERLQEKLPKKTHKAPSPEDRRGVANQKPKGIVRMRTRKFRRDPD